MLYDGICLRIKPRTGKEREVTLPSAFTILEEIRALYQTIVSGSPAEGYITPESSAENVRLVELLRKSAEMDGVPLSWKE